MKAKLLMATLLMLVLGAQGALGSTTGKITGVISDDQTQEPLVGASVLVVGTNLGAMTDADGRYTIINVPVGTYTLKITTVGYSTLEVSNVPVSVDLATYQSHSLTPETAELGNVIRVTAERPLVVADKTTSVDIVTTEEIQAMPTRGFEQIVGIQNSVVRMNSNVDNRQRGGGNARATGSDINLRGGRASEVAYYVDGFSQQDPLSGMSTSNLNNNAIKEIQVTSGAFSAEYGHVASGLVQVTTNSGTDEYHGNLEVVSDNVAEPFGYNSFDHNWYSGDVGGPIPGLNNSYFFVSGERRYHADRTPSIKTKDVFEKYGMDEILNTDDPQRLPYNSLKGWSGQGKLDFNVSPNFKLQLSGNGSLDRWQDYRHYYNNPSFTTQLAHSPLYEDKNLGLNAKITHTLNANTFYDLSFSYFNTTRLVGDGVLFDDYAAYERTDQNFWDKWGLYREGSTVWAGDLDTTLIGTEDDTLISYTEAVWTNYLDRRSSYLGAKGALTTQMNASNTLKAGFDFQYHTVRYFNNLTATQSHTTGIATRLNRFGFDADGEVDDPGGFQNDTKHPYNLGMFVQERFEHRGLIVNAGLRFDMFDYNAKRLIDPSNPFIRGADSSAIDEADLEDSEVFTRLSPRLGISFPISDRTQMHINYGIFYQRPDLANLYVGYDFLEARIPAGSYYPVGSPNLEPETTTQYEVGVTQQLGDLTAIDLTFYYKDTKDLTAIYHQSATPTAWDYYDNQDYGTIKGLDVKFDMKRNRGIMMSLQYSLQYATGTGSYAGSLYNVAWKNPQGAPKQTNPLDYDQRHSLIGIFDLRTVQGEGPEIAGMKPFENMGLNMLVQLASGTPYTPQQIFDELTANAVSQVPRGAINSERLPWSFTIDMKLERKFNIGGWQLTPYLWIRNLLNTENVNFVYEGTGEPDYNGYLTTDVGQSNMASTDVYASTRTIEGPEYGRRYSLLQENPGNFMNPRLIYFGLRVSF